MRFKDLVQRGKRPLGPNSADPTSSGTIKGEPHCQTSIDSQSQRNDVRSLSGMHTAHSDGESRDLSDGALSSRLKDTQNQKSPDSMEEDGQLFRWGSLWAEAYRTVKDDPEYTQLLGAIEKYLREAGNDTAEDSSAADASTVSEGATGLEEIQNLVKTKLEKLPEARIAFSLHGRRIVVRELVQKAIRTVKAFKPIIGGAVSAEPHAALAWAGVLTILPMLENLFQQDEDAATGINNILFILVRYQELQETVLSNELEGSSQTQTTHQLLSNIRTKLVSVYAQVYVYQIRFVLQYGRSKWFRHLRNIVSADDWKQMWKDIESTSRLVDQGVQDRVGTRTLEAWKTVNDVKASTEEIKNLQISTLETELLLSLPFAGNATFDSAEVLGAETTCLEGTQRCILSDIQDWAEDPAGEVMFWLHGMAGTGKTSVALTVAKALNQRKPFTMGIKAPATAFLGASFFFKQGDATRNSTKDFFPTLARCLADVFLDFKPLISSAIKENLAIGTKAPQQQLEYLIVRPLSLLDDQTFLPIRLVIVVDALDECVERKEAKDLLGILASLKDLHQVQLRLLITSRSEKHILESFERLPKVLHRSVLHNKIKQHTEGDGTKDDITFYLSHTLAEIASKHGVAQDCIDQADINRLSKKADGLFIYAATTCRFLDAEDFPDQEARQERLDLILQDYTETDDSDTDDWETDAPRQKVDDIYLKVLSFPDREGMSPKTKKRTYDSMRMTLGFLAVLFEPVGTSALEELLQTKREDLASLLKKLHAIVGVPRDEKSPLDLIHLSFRDFILSKKRSSNLKFRVEDNEMHKEVFGRCLDIMSSKLCRDICGLVMPGTMASEVPHSRIEENIPQHLRYACRYWVDHLSKLDSDNLREVGLRDDGEVHVFLRERFMCWLEAMSLVREIPTAILMINHLQTLVKDREHPVLFSLIYDAKRFILGNRWIIEHAPLQIYASAIVFGPNARKIRSVFQIELPFWVTQEPVAEQEWTSKLSVLEGHTDRVLAIAFSPTNNLVVSVSRDQTSRLWDYTTGTERFRFDERETYCCVAFSPDGKSVALGSESGLVSVREFGKGNLIDLKGHDYEISHVVFSPKTAKILVSVPRGGGDRTIRIWNVDERQTTHILNFPTHGQPRVAEFTPDGRYLMVGGHGNLTMWNVDSGECFRTFDDVDTSYVYAVTISMDGEKAACLGDPKKFCVFNLSTGKRQFEVSYDSESDGRFISLVTLDGNSIIIGKLGSSMEFRDVETSSIVDQFHTSKEDFCFAVSRNGELLMSGGGGGNLKLWDMRSSAFGKKAPKTRDDRIGFIRFSPDGGLILFRRREIFEAQYVADGRVKSIPMDYVEWTEFSTDGRYVVLGSLYETCQLWNKSMTTQFLDSKRLRDIFFSPDGNCMALISVNDGAQIVDSTTFQEILTLEISTIAEMKFSSNGQTFGLSSSDPETGEGAFEFWSLARRTRLWRTTFDCSDLSPRSDLSPYEGYFELSPNGQVAAFRWENEGTGWGWKMLELATGKEQWQPGGGQLVFQPESHLVAIATQGSGRSFFDDPYITIYEMASMKMRHRLKILEVFDDEDCRLSGMAISSTEKLITTVSRRDTQTFKLWDTTTGVEIGRYTIEGYISPISFLDDRYLLCNQGRLPVPFALPDQTETDSPGKRGDVQDCLYVGSQWVYQGLERILWLPPAYRSHYSVMRGETLAIAHETGEVKIVKFNLNETPVSMAQQLGAHLTH